MADSPHTHTTLGPGHEFDAIRDMLALWGDVAQGIGDDAAILRVPDGHQLIVSTDASVEGVHFRRHWLSPRELGDRAAMAALSDLAAMGARADSILISFIIPPDWRDAVLDVAAGLKDAAEWSGASIVGGNIARGDAFSISLTVLGSTETPVRRGTAREGDLLYVTGTLGGPQAAVAALEAGGEPPEWARARFVAPRARLREGAWLAQHGARAMMDISDGLASDARHLAAASNLSASIDAERLPRFPGVTATEALAGGEEYELLVALPASDAGRIAASFLAEFSLPLTEIGSLVAADSIPRVELGGGHDHFSR
jgi:thiamine-monophosphate kinase